jgi:hypothetical protein
MEYITSAERIGMEQGLEKGLEKGRQALLALLESLLKGKFGVLAEKYQQQLDAADVDTLRQWGERIFMAKTPDEVF